MLIVVHGERDPTNVEWQRYVNELAALTSRDTRFLVLSRGGTPSGEQRRTLVTAVGKRSDLVALLTDSVIPRMIVGTLRIFNSSIKAFATTELQRASDFLGLTASERERVPVLLRQLERELTDAHQRVG
jgi:hypothetical protein